MKIRFKACAVILTLVVIFFAGCAESGPASQGGEYFVRKVIDGDTIELTNGRKVRYIGIDTPETMKRQGQDWVFDPEAYGVAAKEHNKVLVSGKKVKLEFDVEKKDKYGRFLAYVYTADGNMVNAEMLREGYATVYTFPPNVKYMEIFLESQKAARLQKRGLWGTLKTIMPLEAIKNTGQYRIVKGEVTDIRISSNRIELDLEGYLKAVIYRGNLVFFEKAGIDLMGLKGKSVEVTGKIEDRGSPQIIVDNPSQLRIV